MSTSFQEIYSLFLVKVSDYSFFNLTQADLEIQLEGFLISSIPRFKHCKTDLTAKDMLTKKFTNSLTESEKEIIVSLMLVEYLKPRIITSEILKQSMSDKDFRLYSQANHLQQLMSLYKEMKSEVTHMLMEYSYLSGDMEQWK